MTTEREKRECDHKWAPRTLDGFACEKCGWLPLAEASKDPGTIFRVLDRHGIPVFVGKKLASDLDVALGYRAREEIEAQVTELQAHGTKLLEEARAARAEVAKLSKEVKSARAAHMTIDLNLAAMDRERARSVAAEGALDMLVVKWCGVEAARRGDNVKALDDAFQKMRNRLTALDAGGYITMEDVETEFGKAYINPPVAALVAGCFVYRDPLGPEVRALYLDIIARAAHDKLCRHRDCDAHIDGSIPTGVSARDFSACEDRFCGAW